MPQLTSSDYLEQRLDNQIDWYSDKSSRCKVWYRSLRIIEIVAAAIIPLLSGMDNLLYGNWIIGGLGMLIAISAATGSLFKYHENWIQYRATSEALKHEKFLFLGGSAPYDEENAFQLLVQRVEGLISKENTNWTVAVKSEPKVIVKG
ncbi:MAG: DUF4231 domain-containing protein [Chlorobium sp.]